MIYSHDGLAPQRSREQDGIRLARDLLGEGRRGGSWRKQRELSVFSSASCDSTGRKKGGMGRKLSDCSAVVRQFLLG